MKLIRWLENRVVIPDDELPDKIDVIVSIGEGFNKKGDNFSFQSFKVHFCTLALYKRFRTHIIFSGGNGYGQNTEADFAGQHFHKWQHRHIENQSHNTYQNAFETLKIIKKYNWKSVILVAQQLHSRRVKRTFEKVFQGTNIKIYIHKAWSPYGNNYQWRYHNFFFFLIWDSLAFIYSKLKNYC